MKLENEGSKFSCRTQLIFEKKEENQVKYFWEKLMCSAQKKSSCYHP